MTSDQLKAQAETEIARVLEILRIRIQRQLEYDLTENIPRGIVTPEESRTHALRHSLVATIGEWLNWDEDQAINFAAEILEDCNLHQLAAFLFDQARNPAGN
jgi:hypothetical protein